MSENKIRTKYKIVSHCKTSTDSIDIYYRFKIRSKELKIRETSQNCLSIDVGVARSSDEINPFLGMSYDDISTEVMKNLILEDIRKKSKELIQRTLRQRELTGWSKWEEITIEIDN